MCPKRLPVAYLSPLAIAVVMLVVCSFEGQSAEAQSSQPPFSGTVAAARPDETA